MLWRRVANRSLPLRFLLIIALFTTFIAGASSLRLSVTGKDVEQCLSVKQLSALKIDLEEQESPIMRKIFAILFPFGPAWNSVLGTFYISSVPNFILAFIPAEIHGDTLNTMTAFATGGLLSDVFLHLVPHSFMGEHQDLGAHFIMVEEKRNILIGLGIFSGFAAFFIMEKTLRVLGGGEEAHGHSHSHAHPSPQNGKESVGRSTGVDKSDLKSRKTSSTSESAAGSDTNVAPNVTSSKGPSKLSAYLNLFGDFVHNITDGLAMAASFYASPMIGATTTLACFAHEIPHEIADYSILIRSGFSKRQAMQSQFLTAIGAFVSAFHSFLRKRLLMNDRLGIAVASSAGENHPNEHGVDYAAGLRQDASGLLGTTLLINDLVIPFVAGGFLYIGAVAVLPTLLEESKSGKQALREFGAMFFGVTCMFFVAWNE
ncbi:hypothetical protein V5O48_002707 [Marasmius crinis-equi]|uniref:ZIP-like iron-zinc transporter n=1 Tax=Marasmius crinis-equi TaxID=585013 RepID=A0ABR3FUY2_9AGAR